MIPTEEELKQFKEKWPDAVYTLWNPPLIGTRVKRLDATRERVGVVVGLVEPIKQTRIHSQTCPMCQCERMETSHVGWVRVQWEGWWALAEGCGPAAVKSKEKPPYATGPMETVDYPPSLVPVTS